MTNKEYNKAKEECWKAVKKELDLHYWGGPTLDIVSHTFDYAFALGKQETKQETDADTVISGWVARDLDGEVFLYENKPERGCYGEWLGRIPSELDFQQLKWDSDPIEVELIIKRKKK